MIEIRLGTKGFDYLTGALTSICHTSLRFSLSKLPLSEGIMMTWVPDALQISEFSLEGLGFDYDEDLWTPFRENIRKFLRQSPTNLVFTETRPVENGAAIEWFRESPAGLRRFAVKCFDNHSMQASWEHYAGVQAPISEEKIESLIDEAFPFSQLYVFTSISGMPELPEWLEERQMEELTSYAQALAVDLFDGSGVLFWRRFAHSVEI